MVFKRKVYDKLLEWKKLSSGASAVLLEGARRIGKSTIVEEFAKNEYDDYMILDFARENKDVRNNFIENMDDLDSFFRNLFLLKGKSLNGKNCVIIFDEVQLFPYARQAIKYLVADGRYEYIETGSLISIRKNVKDILIPSEEYRIKMYPMDFEEFVSAVGVPENVLDAVKKSWSEKTLVDAYIHEKMMQLFQLYIIVGGMPAAVQTYMDSNNIQNVVKEQRDIINLYKKDIARYDQDVRKKLYIDEVFDLIPSELNAKNKRFILKRLNENMTFGRHENDFIWLKDADMALPTYNVEEPVSPLKLSEQRNLFKLFQNDVGLLSCQYSSGGIQLKILQGKVNVNYGSVFENAVAQELHAHGWDLYYFNSKKQGEIDFILETDDEIIPLEVKSGKDYERHNALSKLLSIPNYGIRRAIVLCNDNLHVKGNVEYLPIYMTMFLVKQDELENPIYKVNLEF